MVGVRASSPWFVAKPKIWPAAPSAMSVTGLIEIEACPRRWALASADYPEVWNRRGYPPRLFIASLTGTVIHMALQTITKAFAQSGRTSLQDAGAVEVMRSLGGYTKVINDCVQNVLRRFTGNPRATPMLEIAARSLNSRVPEIRTKAQTLLGRIKLHGGETGSKSVRAGKARVGLPLGPGTYPELELRAPRIGWHGTADLLILSAQGCEIVDFKTGAPDDAHKFQLRVYALLWSRDSELNPTGRLVDKLTISYQSGEAKVDPPTATELDALESDLVERSRTAATALSAVPPQARPTIDNCRYCAVRHLCDEYWQPTTVQALTATAPSEAPFRDLQIIIVARHGPSSWDGVIEHSQGTEPEKPILLRTSSGSELHCANGDRIRVLDALVSPTAENDGAPMVVTMNTMSEAFVL